MPTRASAHARFRVLQPCHCAVHIWFRGIGFASFTSGSALTNYTSFSQFLLRPLHIHLFTITRAPPNYFTFHCTLQLLNFSHITQARFCRVQGQLICVCMAVCTKMQLVGVKWLSVRLIYRERKHFYLGGSLQRCGLGRQSFLESSKIWQDQTSALILLQYLQKFLSRLPILTPIRRKRNVVWG